jgi:dehydrogenase/reductase SDR family protein 12
VNTLQAAIDDLLEILVAPSFSRTGYTIRRRLFGWEDDVHRHLTGRTVVITGPTSGLGRAAAQALAGMGARVILVGRSAERLERTAAEISRATGNTDLGTVVADMGSLASVRDAAARLLASEPRIDILVDNAGAMYPERTITPEGFEHSFATMVLGPFVLLEHLAPRLAASPDGRVVAVTSGGMYTQALPLDDLMFERGEYSAARAYARAKRAQVALVREWARRLRGQVTVTVMHPGWADTPGLAEALPAFHRLVGGNLRSVDEGIDTLLWLAAAPAEDVVSGRLYLDRRIRPFDRIPPTRLSAAERRELWDRVTEMVAAA